MSTKMKRDADGVTHSKPGSVDQQVEDSFPASDAPSYSPGAIGAPAGRRSPRAAGQKTEKAKQPPKARK
jgi:hypothetical protein